VSEVGGKLFVGPTKTGARRTITLPPFLRDLLAEHLSAYPSASDRYVFRAPEGGPLRPRNFRARAWDGAVKAAGVAPLRIHDLRHTTAALLIAQGAHVKEIVERLGHSSPVVTMTVYAHILPSLEERLAEGLERTYRGVAAPLAPGV
jgi:integrase